MLVLAAPRYIAPYSNVVGWIAKNQLGLCIAEQPPVALLLQRIPAKQVMVPNSPKIAEPGHGWLASVDGRYFIHFVRRILA
jgi:hypothetical protein